MHRFWRSRGEQFVQVCASFSLCCGLNFFPRVSKDSRKGRCYQCDFCPLHLIQRGYPDKCNCHVHRSDLESNMGSQILFESMCFCALVGRNQCSPCLLNWMWMLESMTITYSVILQSICVTEKHFFIDHLWTLLACIGLVDQYRNGPNKICASFFIYSTLSLLFPSFYLVVLSSLWIPHLPAFLFFIFFPIVLSLDLLLDSVCWSCVCFFSPLIDSAPFKMSFSCSHL